MSSPIPALCTATQLMLHIKFESIHHSVESIRELHTGGGKLLTYLVPCQIQHSFKSFISQSFNESFKELHAAVQGWEGSWQLEGAEAADACRS